MIYEEHLGKHCCRCLEVLLKEVSQNLVAAGIYQMLFRLKFVREETFRGYIEIYNF